MATTIITVAEQGPPGPNGSLDAEDFTILTGWLSRLQSAIEGHGIVVADPDQQVATPTFLPEAGQYDLTQDVTIDCTRAGATIYYTTNGDDPDSGDTEYTAAIEVAANMTIKAIAIYPGMTDSAIGSAAYTIGT
jgi:hypothetical protein